MDKNEPFGEQAISYFYEKIPIKIFHLDGYFA